MPLEALLRIIGAENVDNGVGVTVAHFVLGFQECNLLHVSLSGHLIEFLHPEIDRLAVLLFNKRKVGGWAFDFFIHAENLVSFRHLASRRSAWETLAIRRHPVVNLGADRVDAWHHHDGSD